ncbi:hypothetical protein BDN70DRAFT_227018 [Pholiota conissans]|uniref:Nuclear pore complex protein n=1 Tax=Pholiota conissans TaxID=109636 RepID=A0A9P5YXI9_9AGAR|nr:hypothetical protein BDN70DRAFT_227018 [Pholiota conissans]
MASSNSEHSRGEQRSAKLTRQNSSFIGAIKNIVKVPLNWFANQDGAGTGTPGKRRRQLDQEPTEEFLDEGNDSAMQDNTQTSENDDEASRHTKRMRIHSPAHRTSQSYLDSPAATLHRVDPSRRTSIVPRASSAVLPSSRATLSPRRHVPVTRTMSIDPPYHTLVRRESSAFDFGVPLPSAEVDYDMAMDDASMPPSPRRSPRPSFRMRSSVTPQPPPARYISEPPPLNTLVSNPVFLHPPAQSVQQTAPTLGALVESVRAVELPIRQQSSALFLVPNENVINNENKHAPSERALHQLDVYKTPLLPTRMRFKNLPASVTATTTPDMFKSRRRSNLILMQDDKDRSSRKISGSGQSLVVNRTKPYAGEGGMKKLLARRKQEAEEENVQKEDEKDTTDNYNTPHARHSPPTVAHDVAEPPVPSGADWFSTAVSTPSIISGSFLRVGRSTNRSHLARPAKARFSAKYDEDVDAEEAEDERTERRPEMAKEAAQLISLFKEPTGFSFSLEAPPMEASKDDDPTMFPISSLPFSIIKSFAPSSNTSSTKPSPQPSAAESKEIGHIQQTSPTTLEQPLASVSIPTPGPKAAPSSVAPAVPPAPSGGGLPNFFANSKLLSEVKLPIPPVMTFGTTPALNPTAPSSSSAMLTSSIAGQPVNEINPFWDGGKKNTEVEPKPAEHLFAGFGKRLNSIASDSVGDAKPPTCVPSAFAPILQLKVKDDDSSITPASYANPVEVPSPLKVPLVSITTEKPEVPFTFPTAGKIEGTEPVATKPLFDDPSSFFGDASKATATAITINLSEGSAAPRPTPSPLPFTFGTSAKPSVSIVPIAAPSSQPSFFGATPTNAPAVEAPKPLFGSSGGFSFGQPVEKKEEIKPSFIFGTTTSAPPAASIATPKPASAPFTFGQPSTTPASTPASVGFSFSGGGSATSDISSKSLFSFGEPITAPTERSITPPKNHENEFRMEESPTRELQQVNNKMPELRPTIGGDAFSFGSSSSTSNGSLFTGGHAAASAPASNAFSFHSTSSNSFAKENKLDQSKGFGEFGPTPSAPPISTSFSFGQTKPAEDSLRPSGFSFGATPTSATAAPGATFSFGAPAASNPFGQSAASGSAPSSPSTFSQSPLFAFAGPIPASGGFSFGSQPASPAAGGNLVLPPSGFGTPGGFGQTQQPSSPFSAPIALAPSTSGGGGSLFTIGSAPAPAPGGARAIKKLPNRRGGVKR